MAVEYRHNPAGLAKLMRSPAMVAEMRRRVELARIHAEAIAPVDTGAYAYGLPTPRAAGGGFQIEAGVRGGRAYGRIVNRVRSAPSRNWPDGYGYGWALEFGNKRIRKQRILGRAVDAIAGR